MFYCDVCNNVSKSMEKERKVVSKQRRKVYPIRQKANPGFKKDSPGLRSKAKSDRIDDAGGVGWEIVKEISVCTDCYQKLKPERVGLR